jgi:hypothetical protein
MNALPLILVSFVSIIHSDLTFASEHATIAATTVSATHAPRVDAPLAFQLKAGDKVEILERQQNYVKIQYKIDDDFPLLGWIPSSALIVGLKEGEELKVSGPSYNPRTKEKIVTEVETFPSMNESPAPIKNITSSGGPDLKDSSSLSVVEPSISMWNPKLTLELGATNYEEHLKTRNPNDATSGYYPGDFLSYELSGASFSPEASIDHEFFGTRLGLLAKYSFMYFSDGISGNPFVNTSNIQAQIHQFSFGPIINYEYLFEGGWRWTPELRILTGFQSFQTNQLSDSRQNQPVLMNLTTLEGRLEFHSRLELPYDNLFIEPTVGISIFNSYSESPQIETDSNGAALSEAAKIRTGNLESSVMQIHYGGNLGLRLVDWGFPQTEIYFHGIVEDYSRDYSGLGNRAGFAVSDVKSTTSLTQLSLGIRRLF